MNEHEGHRERLRKRYLKNGMDMLTDDQALELLLFYALPRRDTNALARKLIAHFGSLTSVLEASVYDLTTVDGIGERAATLISLITPLARRYMIGRNQEGTVLTTTQACGQYLVPYFYGAQNEQVYLLCLDSKCKVIVCKLLDEGSADHVNFSIRKATEFAISSRATSVVLAHNHPAGTALPSNADFTTTLQFQQALQPMEITLIDHIIVAGSSFISLAEHGLFTLDIAGSSPYNTFEP